MSAGSAVDPHRIHRLNRRPVDRAGQYVLWWVASPRITDNHAYAFAAERANALGLPLLAVFGVSVSFPGATARALGFMLAGLAVLHDKLASLQVQLVVRRGPPWKIAHELAASAACVVCEYAVLRYCRGARTALAEASAVDVTAVETDTVVPVGLASTHAEPRAATLRPKLQRLWPRFLKPVPRITPMLSSLELMPPPGSPAIPWSSLRTPHAALEELGVDVNAVPCVARHAGEDAALHQLQRFVTDVSGGLHGFRASRHDAGLSRHGRSELSAYLHFGHIGALTIACAVQESNAHADDKEAFLDGLCVRRELARNMVWYDTSYDKYEGVPEWARSSLDEHTSDKRSQLLVLHQLELAQSPDHAWNSAQRELLATGTMHNRLRMYWCKQLLIWHSSPAEAFAVAVELNDRWMLDGRDPNGYMGIAWCFGRHDEPFAERDIFGKVRSMTLAGLKSKIDLPAYIARVDKLCREASVASAPLQNLLKKAAPPGSLLNFFLPGRVPVVRSPAASSLPQVPTTLSAREALGREQLSLTPEQRDRIKRNREAAERKRQEQSEKVLRK